jgi:excisionase family DNA binding protein
MNVPEAGRPARVESVLAVADHVASPLGRAGQLLYSVEEAAGLLGIGRTFMFHLLATGEIDSLKIGRRRKIPLDAIDGYIERLRAQQGATTKEPEDLPLPGQRDRQRK